MARPGNKIISTKNNTSNKTRRWTRREEFFRYFSTLALLNHFSGGQFHLPFVVFAQWSASERFPFWLKRKWQITFNFIWRGLNEIKRAKLKFRGRNAVTTSKTIPLWVLLRFKRHYSWYRLQSVGIMSLLKPFSHSFSLWWILFCSPIFIVIIEGRSDVRVLVGLLKKW